MSYGWTNLAAATAAADTDRFIAVTDMKRGDYGAPLVAAMPEAGTARHVTITLIRNNAVDTTLGVVTITGTNLGGEVITEVITPLDNATATGTKWFMTVTAVLGGQTWVKDAGAADSIQVGCGAAAIIAQGTGTLHGIQINTTAAATIVVSDATGTIATLPANVAVGTFYRWDVTFGGFLSVALGGASDVTVLHTGTLPSSYAMA
jgi:hypothetical protein